MKPIVYVIRLLVKGFLSLVLMLLWFVSFLWVTAPVVALAANTIRKLTQELWLAKEQERGIKYNDVIPVTIEEAKMLLANRKLFVENEYNEIKKLIDNYVMRIGNYTIICYRTHPEITRLWVDRYVIDGNIISIYFKEVEQVDYTWDIAKLDEVLSAVSDSKQVEDFVLDYIDLILPKLKKDIDRDYLSAEDINQTLSEIKFYKYYEDWWIRKENQ